MINFIVCDDEKEIVEKVKIILMKIAFQANIEYKIHAFNSYDESFMQTMNSNLENKIYILDIEVEDSSGLEVAKQIREKDWKSIIIILTAHYELETLAYKSKILLLDFISKYELYDEKIYNIIKLCIERKLNDDKLKIKTKNGIERIDYKDIVCILYDSYKRKSKIITLYSKYETSESLKGIKVKLKEYISEIIKEQKSVIDNKMVRNIDKLPSGLKGLVYYKLANLDNKILVDLSVSGEIKKFNNIEPKKSKDILKIIGVLLDNAIEAVENADEKYIELNFDIKNNKLKFELLNSYKGNVTIKNVLTAGFSTKGNNRGYGIPLIKDIVNKNKDFELDLKTKDNIFTAILNVEN